ncbi:hypothetical protein FPV67DRAFT_1492691 [Lyophyllum atratum]|nr:hypothetical protein FPV67DRAFT_1492691 [Lyophyllum atratum]
MTGRIVMSSYESLRAAGTSVVCLSPWGDSSPLSLPCIRFRDLAVHTVIVATAFLSTPYLLLICSLFPDHDHDRSLARSYFRADA